MFARLLFAFIVIPLAEIAILVKLGTMIGFWPTIFLQIGTGFLGAFLAKLQGLLVWRKIALELQSGRVPTEDMLNALLILVAGIVLLTPGLLTDLAGFALLVPLTRNTFKEWLKRQFKNRRSIHEADHFRPM